jgi:hypothetical protein
MQGNFYTIDVEVGTPGQRVSVLFDTGSSVFWVNPNCTAASYPDLCQEFGRFSGNKSSTFNDTGVHNFSGYGSGYVNMTYAYDSLSVGSEKVVNQLVGVAFDSQEASFGIMGGGPDTNGWDRYPTVIDSLAKQGLTNSRAYSLDLKSIETQGGSLVFGGIDTGKFSGKLEKRPIIPAEDSPDGATRFWIYLDGITVTSGNGSKVTAYDKVNGQPVLLDSGTSVSYLPGSIVNELVKAYPSANLTEGVVVVDCDVLKSNDTIDFKFGSTFINVRMADFILRNEGSCALGILQNDKMPVLGDTFLRAAYAVYDFDNRNVHLANSVDCGSNLVAIGKGPDAVPSVTGDCAQPSATSTHTGEPVPTSTQASGPTSAVTSEPASTGISGPTTSSPSYSNSTSMPSNSTTTTTAPSSITSKVTVTATYTITSCLPDVVSCPVGSVTTETFTSLTTYCPGAASSTEPLSVPASLTVNISTAVGSSVGYNSSQTQTSPADCGDVPTSAPYDSQSAKSWPTGSGSETGIFSNTAGFYPALDLGPGERAMEHSLPAAALTFFPACPPSLLGLLMGKSLGLCRF